MTDQGTPSSATGNLSDSAIIGHLKACQKIILEQCAGPFEQFMKAFADQLFEQADSAKSNQEQSDLFEQQRLLKQYAENLERYFNGYLGEGFVKFKKRKLETSTGEEKFQGDMLSLVDNDDLEETIAISSITRRAENHYAKGLWLLNQRLSMLNGGSKVHDRGNPMGPVQYCESLRKALNVADFHTKTKIQAYQLFDQLVVSQLSSALEEANDYLAQQGLLPNLRYRPAGEEAPAGGLDTPADEEWLGSQDTFEGDAAEALIQQAPTGSGAAPNLGVASGSGVARTSSGAVQAPDESLSSRQYQGNLLDAIRVLQGHLGSAPTEGPGGQASAGGNLGAGPAVFSGSGGGSATGVGTAGAVSGASAGQGSHYSSGHLVSALSELQGVSGQNLTNIDTGNATPQQIVGSSSQLVQQLKEVINEDGEVDTSDMHTIDLVGMLFEYMLSDDHLPDSVKALLSYLYTPFMKIAFIDKTFFEETEHPARILLNSLAEAGVKWVSNDGTSQYEMSDKIKSIVSRVLEEFKNDVRIFAELLLDFSSYTKKISRRQDLMERRATEKVQGEERLREVKIRVNTEVRMRTDGKELPSAVLLMLLQPWSDYLSFILLRYGESSDSWQRGVEVIDDVLWSIQAKKTSADKTRQLEMHDNLVDSLDQAFETIGYDQAKAKKLLDALFSLQKMALQSIKVEAAPQEMRAKLETMAAEKAGQSDETEGEATEEETQMVENLKMIEFGTWFEFEGGKRLKVAWYNSKTLHYMLVDQMGKKVTMKSGLELARDMLSHQARVIAGSSKPFFERALENIFQSLNAKAELMKPEETQ